MTRRLFWVTAGAVAGVAGYRRVSRLARTVRAGEAVSFARDVRRGMDLYLERHQELAGPSLVGQRARVRRASTGDTGETDPGRGRTQASTMRRMAVDGVGRDRPPFP
jgi:hypothetical protein